MLRALNKLLALKAQNKVLVQTYCISKHVSNLGASPVKEKLYSLQSELKKTSDTFGNFSELSSSFDFTDDDPEDVKEKLRLRSADRQSQSYYINIIKSHLRNHEYAKAVELLENRMLKVDRVKPDSYIYDLLISYCGRQGEAHEAFRLYNQIKKHGFHVTGGQYTSLFNACANSPQTRKSLEIATKLKEYLFKDEVHKYNIKNCNAMLKAFGRHGDLKSALEIMDEVLERRGRVLADTYGFLLQACISDRNSGFRLALLVWHRLLQNKTDPCIFTFNLMLRAVRDCGLGVPEHFQSLVKSILHEGKSRFLRKVEFVEKNLKALPTPTDQLKSLDPNDNSTGSALALAGESIISEVQFDLPNLLAVRPTLGSLVDLASFTTSYHRLMLLGGVRGFLNVMESVNVKPDVKTLSLLLEIIPSNLNSELEFLDLIGNLNVKLDTGFFNTLMKKRSFRSDYTGAKEVLSIMQLHSAVPDLITFGTLALGCKNLEQAEHLLSSIKEAGYRCNSHILGALVRNATYAGDIQFLRIILRVMKEDSVQPSPKLLILVSSFMEKKEKLLNASS